MADPQDRRATGARPAPATNRLPGDRRRIDRRATPRPHDQGSAAWIAGADSLSADSSPAGDESRFAADWGSGERAAADSRFLQRRLTQPRLTAFQRIYRVFLGARAAIGVILIAMLALTGLFGIRPTELTIIVSVFYAAWALSMWLLPRFGRVESPKTLARPQNPQWLASIGIDIVCFMTLHMMSPGGGFNYSALLVLPVLMAGVLTPRLMALATSAAVTLLLLFFAWIDVSGGEVANLLTQAGLAGSGLFVIAVLAGELAGRLAREETAARGSLELARQQEQLNRLVIEEMQDGVLVVDRRGRVRAANPAARRLLAVQGMCRPAPFELHGLEAWQGLIASVERAFADASWPEEGRDVVIRFDPGLSRTVRLRVRFAKRGDLQSIEDYCVLLLEDLRNLQARVRQEKLAAMGRVSAGIAHEIRNPLAAIAQANSLLEEDATSPAQRQLTKMVRENVERLKRIVDDVMEVAPGRAHAAGVIDLSALCGAAFREWAAAAGLRPGRGCPVQADLPAEPLGAVFDPDHLRRVLINLLDNARRHASGAPGSVVLRLFAADGQRAVLSVASDGDPIAPDVERFLFEPFFSTRSRGTGLGLYICRELCERYGAMIEYRTRPAGEPNRNDFSVVMKRAALSDGSADVDQLAVVR
ncbi:sensor histidine kinase [Piscinibacter sakaiensis]|uniref:sensor histidine kinase n=1 Tax=Piscinibacter sakaiensis TaxID=1547922 RepID=UPI003AAEBBF7